MDSDRVLVTLTIVLVLAAAINNFILLSDAKSLSGKSIIQTANIGICLGNPNGNILSTNCNKTYYENGIINCSFYSNNINSVFFLDENDNNLMNISSNGKAYQELNYSFIGNHSQLVYATDWCSVVRNITHNYSVLSGGNHPPILIKNIPKQNLIVDTTIVSLLLQDYFIDIDGDKMTYTTTVLPPNLVISISINDIVSFSGKNGYTGKVPMQIIATDIYNASTYSNVFWVEVLNPEPPKVEEEKKKEDSASSASGGFLGKPITCTPLWECGNWTTCQPHGYRLRDCYDTKKCNVSIFRPELTENCEYIPTCFDKLKNGLEEGIDCGPICDNECRIETCFDGKKNFQETGVDCGGVCDKVCGGNCFDKIQNGDEEGIDCGGSCNKKCAITESPIQVSGKDYLFLILLLIIIALIISGIYIHKNKKNIKRIIKKLKRKQLPQNRIIDYYNEFVKLEASLEHSTSKKIISEISNLIIRYLTEEFEIENVKTLDEMFEIISSSDDSKKPFILSLIKELNLQNYSNSILSKSKLKSLIYEGKALTTLDSTQAMISEFTPVNKEDLYSYEIRIIQEMLNKKIANAKVNYLELHKLTKEKGEKDLFHSLDMVYKLIGYYEIKK